MQKIYFDGTEQKDQTLEEWLSCLDVSADVTSHGDSYKVVVNPSVGTGMFMANSGIQMATLSRIAHKTETRGAYYVYYIKKNAKVC